MNASDRGADCLVGVPKIILNGYVDPAPPPAPSFMPSEAIGVGNLLDIAADDPASGPLVIGSDVASTNHERPAGVAECFQCSEDGISAASSEVRAVFKSEPTRADFSDDADCFEVEPAARAFDAFAFGVGAGDVLARGASNDDGWKSPKISNKLICCERADIVINANPWIVLLVECPTPVHELASGNRLETSSVHTERPPAGRSAKQVQDFHHCFGFPTLAIHSARSAKK
nr:MULTISPECIES: hypothetical protein [Rhizobium]